MTAGSREDTGERDRCVCVRGVTAGETTEGGRAREMRASWIFPPRAVGRHWKAFSKGEMSCSSGEIMVTSEQEKDWEWTGQRFGRLHLCAERAGTVVWTRVVALDLDGRGQDIFRLGNDWGVRGDGGREQGPFSGLNSDADRGDIY